MSQKELAPVVSSPENLANVGRTPSIKTPLKLLVPFAAGLLGGVLGSALFFVSVGTTTKGTTGSTISAQELRLVDSTGKARAALGFNKQGCPSLNFIRRDGKVGVTIGLSDEFGDFCDEFAAEFARKQLLPKLRREQAELSLHSIGHDIDLSADNRGSRLMLDFMKDAPGEDAGIWLGTKALGPGNPALCMDGRHASIELREVDKKGDRKERTVIGATNTVTTDTGEETLTPLSSITFFDNSGNVIWKAR